MNNKHDPFRRKFFAGTFRIIPAAALTSAGLVKMSAALAQTHEKTPSLDDYSPGYFNEDEWAFLLFACDRLIPAEEDGAGALAARVPVFIDQQLQTPFGDGGLWYMQGPFHPEAVPQLGYQLRFSPKEIYRIGIADTQTWCKANHDDKRFQALSEAQQIDLLGKLESGAVELENIPAAIFFQFLWANTKEGYFADPQYGGNNNMTGWKAIGFPGARADFMDWVEQPGKPYPFGPVAIDGKRG